MLHGQRTGELFNLVNNFVISNVVLGTETAPGHVTIAEDTSASFLNVLEKFTLVDLVQVLCRGTLSWTGDNWSGQSYIRLPSYFDMCSLRAIKDVVVRTLIHTPTPPQRNPSNGEKMHVLPRRIMHRGPTTPTTLALVCLARLHTLCREMIYHTDEFIDHCETFPFLSRNLLMQLNHSREGLVQTGRAISNQMAIVHRSIMQLMVNDEWH